VESCFIDGFYWLQWQPKSDQRNGLWWAIQPKRSTKFNIVRDGNELNAVRIAVHQIQVIRQMRCLMRVISRVMTVVVAYALLFQRSIVMAVAVIVCRCQFGMPRLLCGVGIHYRMRR